MRVEASKQALPGHTGGFARDGATGDAPRPKPECRALVATAPAAVSETGPIHRQAAFLAHLIATKEHAPQTRERRRAEPSEALAAYRVAAALMR